MESIFAIRQESSADVNTYIVLFNSKGMIYINYHKSTFGRPDPSVSAFYHRRTKNTIEKDIKNMIEHIKSKGAYELMSEKKTMNVWEKVRYEVENWLDWVEDDDHSEDSYYEDIYITTENGSMSFEDWHVIIQYRPDFYSLTSV